MTYYCKGLCSGFSDDQTIAKKHYIYASGRVYCSTCAVFLVIKNTKRFKDGQIACACCGCKVRLKPLMRKFKERLLEISK